MKRTLSTYIEIYPSSDKKSQVKLSSASLKAKVVVSGNGFGEYTNPLLYFDKYDRHEWPRHKLCFALLLIFIIVDEGNAVSNRFAEIFFWFDDIMMKIREYLDIFPLKFMKK